MDVLGPGALTYGTQQCQQGSYGFPVSAGGDGGKFCVKIGVGQLGIGDTIGEVQVDVAALDKEGVGGGAMGI